MRSDACQFFYECRNCKTLLRPKRGDCYVFCSYGSVKCVLRMLEIQGFGLRDDQWTCTICQFSPLNRKMAVSVPISFMGLPS